MAAQSDALLSTVFAMAAEWHVADFNAQDLTNTAWAFARVAMVGQSDTLLNTFFGLGESSRGTPGRLWATGARHHSMSISEGGRVGCAVGYNVGNGSRALPGQQMGAGSP